MFIESTYNTTARVPGLLVGSAYSISLFWDEDPSTLIDQIDSVHIDHIKVIMGAPECVEIVSKTEKKTINFCFADLRVLEAWQLASDKWELCRKGQNIKEMQISLLSKACEKKTELESAKLFEE